MAEDKKNQTGQPQQQPNVVELEDLDAIADPDEKRWRKLLRDNENIAPFSEPVFLMHADSRTMYAVGWSLYDLLIDMTHDDGTVFFKNRPLCTFATHAPWYLNKIDPTVLEQLRQNQPTIILCPPSKPQTEKAE